MLTRRNDCFGLATGNTPAPESYELTCKFNETPLEFLYDIDYSEDVDMNIPHWQAAGLHYPSD